MPGKKIGKMEIRFDREFSLNISGENIKVPFGTLVLELRYEGEHPTLTDVLGSYMLVQMADYVVAVSEEGARFKLKSRD
jgi:hypothetical protein